MLRNVSKILSNASAMLGNVNAVLSNASAMLSHASSILSNAITMLSNAVQYKAMLRNTYTMQEQILMEWLALLCTQRPICSRVCLISKKFLSIIYHPTYTSTRSSELAARAQKVFFSKSVPYF